MGALLVALAVILQLETIVDIRVHGNVATSDDEVRRLAGVEVGSPVSPNTVAEVTARLRATKRFDRVEVLKRYASISDPSQILLVIIVDEGIVEIKATGDSSQPTRVVKKGGPNLMFLPLVSAEDGYGLIYGGEFAIPNPAGPGSRVMFPLTWGGEKRAAVELEKDFGRGPFTRASGGVAISRRTHPFFQRDEDRGRVWARGERDLTHSLRVGANAGWQHVSFLDVGDSFAEAGADVTVDTRLDPMLARNAVYGRAAVSHLAFGSGGGANRLELDARGYIGLFGQSVLVLRGVREDADGPLPVFLKPMLGGLANVRGFRAGTAIGDTLVAGSAEVRIPLTSPLDIGKIGVNAFVDTGTVYDKGGRLADQAFKRGFGGGVWLSAAIVRINLAVAQGIGGTTRVHVGGSLSF